MSRKHRKSFIALGLVAAILFTSASVQDTKKSKQEPLIIQEQWRVFLEMARRWRDAVNKRGGNVTLVHLPEIDIRGNTHFPMSDMNNLEIADLLSKFLKEKGLD